MNLVPGKAGQFEVRVDGNTVARREGNLITRRLFRIGWPEHSEVIAGVKAAIAGQT